MFELHEVGFCVSVCIGVKLAGGLWGLNLSPPPSFMFSEFCFLFLLLQKIFHLLNQISNAHTLSFQCIQESRSNMRVEYLETDK